ncbi:MAG TPA: hypothetical protein VGS20_00345 [Candidatus Acidoferrales bacterium]|nr:hypothetical protein [Candidatus Acidoferrales bacterium]
MARVTLHPTLRNFLSVIAGVCVVGLAIIPLTVSADHLSWVRWEMVICLAAGLAVAALIVQACLQSAEDARREQREQQRDKREHEGDGRIQGILDAVQKGSKSPGVPTLLVAEPAKLAEEQKADKIFDGELQRIFMYERTGLVPYKMLQEIFQISGRTDEPTVDCDILVSIYLVNASSSIQYIKELTASVEVNGRRVGLERRNDFRLKSDEEDDDGLEYGFESLSGKSDPEPLRELLTSLPCELLPNKPLEGWIRYTLKQVVPPKIDSNSWKFAIVDSLGNQHFLTKTSDAPKKGEIGLRRCR